MEHSQRVIWSTSHNSVTYINPSRPATWSIGQSFWLMIMRSRVRFPVLAWGFSLEGEDSHGDHGLGSLVELRLRSVLVLLIHVSPTTSSGQRSCASWAFPPQKLVTLQPQRGGVTTKSIRDMWWYWRKTKTLTLQCAGLKFQPVSKTQHSNFTMQQFSMVRTVWWHKRI
jgi:hypothetical protein